jgi:hypothetical protein
MFAWYKSSLDCIAMCLSSLTYLNEQLSDCSFLLVFIQHCVQILSRSFNFAYHKFCLIMIWILCRQVHIHAAIVCTEVKFYQLSCQNLCFQVHISYEGYSMTYRNHTISVFFFLVACKVCAHLFWNHNFIQQDHLRWFFSWFFVRT